ncbi:hypothetical protein ACYSNW_00815 [Enterococcus sp. LJL99]
MDQEVVLQYVELALTNLNYNKQMKYNIEGEVYRLMRLYDEEQLKKKVDKISFKQEMKK